MSAQPQLPASDRQPATPPAPPTAGEAQRPQPMALQGVANRVVRALLRTPLVCRLAGRRLITIYAVGRRTGRAYTVPVAYTRHEGTLLFGTAFRWAHNLRSGEPVDIRYKGKRIRVAVEVVTDEEGVVANYAIIARDNHQFAAFNHIGLDAEGRPNSGDLHLAWTVGARVVRLTPP